MIELELLTDDGIAIVEPKNSLSKQDFKTLAESVDAYLATHDCLNGLLIHVAEFPGWNDLGGFVAHMKFVKDHHRKIKKVALASDSRIASIVPTLANHFVAAEVKSFEYEERDEALAWLKLTP